MYPNLDWLHVFASTACQICRIRLLDSRYDRHPEPIVLRGATGNHLYGLVTCSKKTKHFMLGFFATAWGLQYLCVGME